MGVGNRGPHLLPYAECGTFLSRDAGHTWVQVRDGESLYEFGDQGTIIVVIDDEGPTNEISYSWNYGESWDKYKFSKDPIRATLLTTNPKSTSLKFLLMGQTLPATGGMVEPVVYTIDFSELEPRKCMFTELCCIFVLLFYYMIGLTCNGLIIGKASNDNPRDSDFELWSPLGDFNECLLGKKVNEC
jgi:hypothetical protein